MKKKASKEKEEKHKALLANAHNHIGSTDCTFFSLLTLSDRHIYALAASSSCCAWFYSAPSVCMFFFGVSSLFINSIWFSFLSFSACVKITRFGAIRLRVELTPKCIKTPCYFSKQVSMLGYTILCDPNIRISTDMKWRNTLYRNECWKRARQNTKQHHHEQWSNSRAEQQKNGLRTTVAFESMYFGLF